MTSHCRSLGSLVAWTALLLAAAVAAPWPLRAQLHDTKGKEYWVAFMENIGSGPEYQVSDMRLYVSSDSVTSVRVIYHATRDTVVVALPVPDQPVEININALFGSSVELKGGEEVSGKVVQILSEHDVTLYGVSVRRMSADAFLGIPDDVLTRAYIVLAYPNGFITSQQGFDRYDTPSEFAVIATEDGTVVNVSPQAPLNGRSIAPFTIGLDRGEVFFAQAQLDRAWDVSGTEIRASKPVAVFGGNKRTAVPTRVGNYRDHLCEQMPPLEVWGREAIITPHFPITPASTDTAVVRILAAFDGTTWEIDGVPQPVALSHTASKEVPLLRAMRITASGPILVAQYEHSVNVVDPSGQQFDLGDPFMMIVPPTEQFDTAYAFQSIKHPEFLRHFINVVIPTVATGSLRLDGKPTTVSFTPVGSTGYSYAQIGLGSGAHYIRCDSAFGLYAYGYGRANSYGYTGGMLFRKLVNDYQAPAFDALQKCGRVDGFAYEGNLTDTGIDSCYVIARETNNALVSIEPFVSGVDTVRYSATLVNPYLDGAAALKAIDSGGRSRTQINPIPGFTLRAFRGNAEGVVVLDTVALFNGGSRCRSFDVENYGRYPHTITSISFDPPVAATTSTTPLPITIPPGGRRTIEVCMTGWVDTALIVKASIGDGCAVRAVAAIPIVSGTDTTAPSILGSATPCGRDVTVMLSESSSLYSGIDSISLDELTNCRFVDQLPGREGLPAGSVAVRLASIDQRYDMIYQVTVTDVAGNRRTFRDTVGGFTLALLDKGGDTCAVRLDRAWIGDSVSASGTRCDTVTITNYGSRELDIREVRLRSNRHYSVPPSQLPMLLPAHSTRSLMVCLDGATALDESDTLELYDGCGREELLLLKTPVRPVLASGTDRCDNSLSIRNVGASKRTFLTTPVPNPSPGGAVRVDLGLKRDEMVALEIFDQNGSTVKTVLRGVELAHGIHRIEFDLARLESGTYFCRLTTGGGEVLVQKMIVGR